MRPTISVVICTYNRAEMLGGALESLCRQAAPADSFEIVVVDNGSTDHTTGLVADYQERYPRHCIELLYEPRQGLGFARNKALANAHGHYIAYLDDDARASPHWLALAFAILGEQPEAFVCLGGPILPFYTTPKPEWFQDAYEIRSLGPVSRKLRAGESLPGSNMIWHTEKLMQLGGFDEGVGVRGTELSLGEETVAFTRAWQQLAEPLVLYSPELIVRHLVPDYKLNVSYHLRRSFANGQVAVRIGHYRHGRTYLLLGALKEIVMRPFLALARVRKYRYWQNWAIEEGRPLLLNIGKILGALGIYVSVQQK